MNIDTSTIFSMIFSNIFNIVKEVWFLLPILVIVWFFRTPRGKGIFGELIVNSRIKNSLDNNEYHLIKDVTLQSQGGTTQIDHIVLSKYGLFVIETKNMSGWIFGDEKQKYWTQVIYKKKNKFQNPLHQNYKHIKTLQELLNVNEDTIHSVIVFIGDSKFKTQMPPNVLQGDYINYIKSFTEPIFSDTYISNLKNKIENNRLKRGFKTNREHVKNVQKIVKSKST